MAKHNLKIPVVTFNGIVLTQAGPVDVETGKPTQTPVELKDLLENACVNADPNEHNNVDRKMAVYRLLTKIHKADPFCELTSEDVTLLKNLVGKAMNVAAVGPVVERLENPVGEVTPLDSEKV